ncbi:MAG: signal peptidase I [Bdellovibrionales bacterium]
MNETFKSLLWAAAIALLIRCFAYEPFSIPSSSMVPTLQVGDFLFVSKFEYGYSAKSSFFGIPLFDGRTSDARPKRGDVVVFKLPANTSTDYIKRIIGLPGDRLQVVQGRLYINDQLVERKFVREITVDKGQGRSTQVREYTELLPNGVSHTIYEEGDNRPQDNTPVYEVPPNHYFGMGDNRDNSADSRVMNLVGYIPEENLVGKAKMIFFSLKEGTRFLEFWRWPFDIRFSRIFSDIR